MCTLKQFPSKIEHCIEWSKIKFEELFRQTIKELKLIIDDPKNFLQF